MLTPAGFKTRFPEFASVSDERVQLFIDEAKPLFNAEVWGNQHDTGMGYVVAHELALDAQAEATKASAGDIVEKRVGEVTVKRDASVLMAQAKDQYLLTRYGQKYKQMIRSLGTGVLVV